MSDEERRSRLASIAAGGGPSIEPDTIDNLTQPIACNLILSEEAFKWRSGEG
jgi:hypothetical protein